MEKFADKNMLVPGKVDKTDIVWYDAKEEPFRIHGADSGYHRLPEDFTILQGFIWHSAGVRVRFVTDSPYIAIRCKISGTYVPTIMAHSAVCGFDLYKRETDGREVYVSAFRPPDGVLNVGYEGVINTQGENCYTLNLPLFSAVTHLEIGVKDGSKLEKAPDYNYLNKPIVFYGSSITHGAAASRPGNSYCAMIGQMLGADHINLGFSGNAKGEQEIADYIANLDMCAFVLDYHHNAYDLELLRKTHYNFYKTVREKHPFVPIILVSAPTAIRKDNWITEGKAIIQETYRKAKADLDKNIYFVDGSKLFDGPFAESCIVDTCHPNDLGFYRMAMGIGKVVAASLGKDIF